MMNQAEQPFQGPCLFFPDGSLIAIICTTQEMSALRQELKFSGVLHHDRRKAEIGRYKPQYNCGL